MYNRKPTTFFKHIDFVLVDEVALLLSFLIAKAICSLRWNNPLADENYFGLFGTMAIMLVLTGIIIGNYHDVLRRGYFIELGCMVVISLGTMSLTALTLYLLKISQDYSRLLIVSTFIGFVFIGFGLRTLRKKTVIRRKKAAQAADRHVFVLTEMDQADEICGQISGDYLEGYTVVAAAVVDGDADFRMEGEYTVIPFEKASDYICREWIDEVFVYLPGGIEKAAVFLAACSEMAVTVHYVLNLQNADQDKQFIEQLHGKTVLTTAFNYMSPHQRIFKRTADILGGIAGSILAVLVMLVVGPIVYAKDPGPILFRQERIGRNGKHFYIYKIRSMYMNAEEMKKEYLAKNRVSDGYMFKMEDDPRILPGIGNFIRKTSLDEFPQFFNVLFGEMSLVGTRPPTVDEWEKYKYHHRARLAMRPGITGMWQVSGRSEITDFEEVVKLDTYYISHYRISLDIKILFKTVAVLFGRKGAM